MNQDFNATTSVERASVHRAPAVQLPADPQEASACVLRFIQTSELAFDRSAALEALNKRVECLAGASGAEVERELLAQLQVLQALFLRYSTLSVTSLRVEAQAAYTKLALACQSAYARTAVVVAGLRAQRGGSATVAVEHCHIEP